MTKYGVLAGLSIAIVIAAADACFSRERVSFSPPPQWLRASFNAKFFPDVIGMWFPVNQPATSHIQSITLEIVPVAARVRAGAVLTGLLKDDSTGQVLHRRSNGRCKAGTSEVLDLRSHTQGVPEVVELVATSVHGAIYLAYYTRAPQDPPDKTAVNAVESMRPL